MEGFLMRTNQSSIKSYKLLYILLIIVILAGVKLTCDDLRGVDPSEYKTITVKNGDSLWGLAATYRGDMSNQEFVSWVEKENNLTDRNIIQVGQKIVLPIKRVPTSGNSEEKLAGTAN
jgi:LysM repeat protein